MNNVYMREEMRELWKLFEYSRWYPNIGIEHILGVNLPIHQQSMAREIWYHQDIVNLSSRRCGKTFVSGGVIPMLLCILFDNFKVGIVSPNFRTSGVAFGEAEKIYENSALVRALCKREPVHGSGSYRIEFKNGSVIEAAPLGSQGDGLRGKGYHYIFCDEYAYLSNGESILNNVLLPMLFTKRTISDNVHPMGSFNRMVISSTADYVGSQYHKKVLEFDKLIKNGSDKHSIVSFDYRDGILGGRFDAERSRKQFEESPEDTRKSEFLNVFVDFSSNGFIGYDLLKNKAIDSDDGEDSDGNYIPPKTRIEFEGEKDKQYALVFDDSDGGGDNFACALIKMDGGIKRLVRMKALGDAHINEKIRLIRDWYRKFNVVLIGCDQRNKNILDSLDSYYEYPDGKIGECIIKKDDEEALERVQNKYGNDVKVAPIVIQENFSSASNEYRAKTFAGDIQKGNFKIPSKINLDSKEEIEEYNEIQATISEIVRIKPEPAGQYVRYIMSSRRMPKDRFTCCELGNYLCNEYMKDMEGRGNSNIYIGGWRR